MAEENNTTPNSNFPSRRDADFPEHHVADDEISLYDLWDVLMRRLPVLIGVASVVVLGGLAYALLQPVEYDYRSGIDLPRIYHEEGMELVVSPESAIARLQDVIIPSQRLELFDDEEGGPRIRVLERGGDQTLVLESTSSRENMERVSRIHEAVITVLGSHLEDRYQNRLDANLRPLENRAEATEEQLAMLQEQLEEFSGRIDRAGGVSALVMAQQAGDLRREIGDIRRELVDTRSTQESIRSISHGTEMTFLASESEDPSGTGRSLIMALSVVLGGMLGLFSAFFWEFVTNARRRNQANAP